MAKIKLSVTLVRHYGRDVSDAQAVEGHGQPDAARSIHSRAPARWEELGKDIPERRPSFESGLEQRARKAGDQWQLGFNVALGIPMKAVAALPEAEALRRPADPKEDHFPVPAAASLTTRRTSPRAQATGLTEATRR